MYYSVKLNVLFPRSHVTVSQATIMKLYVMARRCSLVARGTKVMSRNLFIKSKSSVEMKQINLCLKVKLSLCLTKYHAMKMREDVLG
jgi:hypothetical protein